MRSLVTSIDVSSSQPIAPKRQPRSLSSGGKTLAAITRTMRAARNRILLVDDDPLLLRLTEAILIGEGYRVDCCSDGAQALKQFRRHPAVSLLLTDIHMSPDMNGLELAAKVGAENPDLPVVVMSGAMISKEQEELMRQHCWAFVDKPLSVPRLLSVISILLRGFSPQPARPSMLSRKAG